MTGLSINQMSCCSSRFTRVGDSTRGGSDHGRLALSQMQIAGANFHVPSSRASASARQSQNLVVRAEAIDRPTSASAAAAPPAATTDDSPSVRVSKRRYSSDEGDVLATYTGPRTPPRDDAAGVAGVAVSTRSATGDVEEAVERRLELTGGALGLAGATPPLVKKSTGLKKRIVLLRHGQSSWNDEGRVQGSSDESVLSELGEMQALRCRQALRETHFDFCYASPISRAKLSAEIIWEGRKEPLLFRDSLKEANLHFLQGMLNSDAKRLHPESFRLWREDPSRFCVGGVYPVHDLWGQAKDTWRELMESEGTQILVVTHKSLLRALLCTALGLGPEMFRAMDVNNAGICVVVVNDKGEPMIESLNMTAHLQSQAISYRF